MRRIILLGLLVVVLIGGCVEVNEQVDSNLEYFENCINNPDGYWNEDTQKCDSRYDKLKSGFGEDHCVELHILDHAELIRGTNYVIYIGGDIYTLEDFQLESNNELSESEYQRSYEIRMNYSDCKGTMRFLDFYSEGWYEYRLKMPYCDNENATFYVCEEGAIPPTDNQPPQVTNATATPVPFSGEEELAIAPKEPFSMDVSVPQGGVDSVYGLLMERTFENPGLRDYLSSGYSQLLIINQRSDGGDQHSLPSTDVWSKLRRIPLYGMGNECIHQTDKLIPIYNSSGQITEIVEKTEWDNNECGETIYTLKFYN